MVGFFIGMLAFALWVGVMVGIYRALRANPGHPFWSIARFKSMRRSIAPELTPPPQGGYLELAAEEPPAPPRADWADPEPPRSDPWLSKEPPDEPMVALEEIQAPEMIEVETMLASVTAHKKPRPPRAPRKRASGPMKVGRVTYVLVDDEGRPEL